MPLDRAVGLGEHLDDLFLVRDGDAESLDAPGRRVLDELGEVLARHAEGNVDLVELQVGEGGVVDQRAEAVAHRIGDHAVDLGLGVDLVVVIDFRHLLEAELARRQRPLVMEGGEAQGRAEASAEDPGGRADVAHADADGGNLALARQLQHPQVVAGMVGHGADLDDVGVQAAEAPVDFSEVVGRLAEVVVADDPLGLAEAGDLAGDVLFEIDVLDPLGDGRPQQHQALIFAAGEFSPVRGAAAGDDDRAGPVGDQPLDVRLAVDVIDAEFDELGALLDEVAVFGDDVAMAAAADADADHGRD